MPKRKIRDLLPAPDQDAALAAIREALKHPKPITPDAARAHHPMETHVYTATVRRGTLVFREPGKAGADLPVPPYAWEMLKRQRDFATECAKVDRALSLRYRHQLNARERAQRIRELAKTITGRGRIECIAHKVGCSVSTVRRALKGKPLISKVTDSK